MGAGALLQQGLFDEALVYGDDEALYFETGGKDSGIVRFTFEMLEILKRAVEDDEEKRARTSPGGEPGLRGTLSARCPYV
jgi:hypothetical protein